MQRHIDPQLASETSLHCASTLCKRVLSSGKMVSVHSSLSAFFARSQLMLLLPLWLLCLARVDAGNQSEEVDALLTFRDTNTFNRSIGL